MKIQIIILLLLSSQLAAQNPHFPVVKISVPCTEDFINHYKGKWLIHDPNLSPISVNDFHAEVIKRLNQIHALVFQTHPQPIGNDAIWTGGFTKSSFANEVKYIEKDRKNEYDMETVRTNPVYCYTYNLALCGWGCHGENQIMNGYPYSGGGGMVIRANDLEILNQVYVEGNEWTINGLPIKQKMSSVGNWKGFDVMSLVAGPYESLASEHFMLISRDGVLPYIPVTRKQFFDRAIPYVTKYYDGWIADADQEPDKTEREQRKNRTIQDKNAALRKLHDALEKATRDGLLDAPAIVRRDPLLMNEGPVFLSEVEGGVMLATENPNYIRKDLPKYVPQFFVIQLLWTDKGWSKDFKKIIEDNFPIEKLQAMIDK
ncbi:MAG TPA: hypothetical protein VFP87_00430 [Chitinophagaceae bacterium]|nr:hypothetical protein [Chitinophagaceae bacterium]